MRYKWIYGFLALFVSALMLMPNVFASPIPPIWLNQATLSIVDGNPSQDPEISGFGLTQAVVWEEWNPVTADWDIMMRYNPNDGNPLNWVPGLLVPPITVAGTPLIDEINPAVTVTNINPVSGFQEVHVIYQSWNPAGGGQWDVCHTWTPLPIIAWSAPRILDIFVNQDAVDPAIVYTEDLLTTTGALAYLIQFTWSESNPANGLYEIQYDAHYFDTALWPIIRGYVPPFLIQACPFGNCMYPKIASVDETAIAASNSYYFSIVWQEPTRAGQINVWYNDGITQTFPVMGTGIFVPGQINPVGLVGHSVEPDIAAAQDYYLGGLVLVETYYFHVIWEYHIPGPPPTYQIDTCYTVGPAPTPGAAALALGPTAPARGPVNFALEESTIATKLLPSSVIPPTPVFETWMCWQDSVPNPASTPPDIWFRVGQYPMGAPPAFAYTFGPALVPYIQPLVAPLENNPELWNRGDSTRLYTLFTHLVFDMGPRVPPPSQEVEYIDP